MGIIPGDAVFVRRVVEVTAFVQELNHIRKSQKSVCETSRDVKLIVCLVRKNYASPFSEMRRAAPNVYSNIKGLAFDDSA